MSIQIDNGEFTRIHNIILEKMAMARFTAMEFRCLLYLVRMTYGWQKKEDAISLSQWAKGIGLDTSNRGNMLNTLNGLVSQGVIYTRSNGKNRPATWGLNKAYFEDETVMQPHNSYEDESEPTVIQPHNTSVIQPHNTPVIQPHNSLPETVMQPHNHKRKDIKERTTKKEKEKPRARSRSGDVHPNTRPIMDAYVEALGYKPTHYAKELSAAKKLAIDGREPADVSAAYAVLKQEPFWQRKHLSLHNVAEQIPALHQALVNGVPLTREPANGKGAPVDKTKAAADFVRAQLVASGREDILRG